MRLNITLILCLATTCAFAQPRFELGVFGQYEFDLPSMRSFQSKGVSPGVQAGMVLEYPNRTIHVYLSGRWEAFRERTGEVFLFGFGMEEELLLDNLVVGPGLMVRLAKNRRIQPLLGLEIFIGIPLRTRYEMVRTEDISFLFLPEYWQADGGALFQAGTYFYTGLSSRIANETYWELKLGMGHGTQTFNWNSIHPVDLEQFLLTGWYTSARLGLTKRF